MNTIENLLRDAYRTAAETIQPGTLRDLQRRPTETSRQRASARRRRVLFPVAAAAAVIAVVTGLALTGSLLGTGSRQPDGTSRLGPGVPLFYVAAEDVVSGSRSSLVVYETATGRVVGRVPDPKGTVLDGTVAALAGDRTFITAAYPGSLRTDLVPPGQCVTHLYEFRVNDEGHPTALSRLPFTVPGHLTSLSVTPDGRFVAYATDLSCGPISGSWVGIGVVNTASGQARSWPLRLLCTPKPTCSRTWDSVVRNVALSADGRQLAFSETLMTADSIGTVARILPTSAPAGSYEQRSASVPQSADTMWTALSADGSSVYTCSFPMLGLLGGGRKTAVVAYNIDSTAGGPPHLLASWPPTSNPVCAASLDTSGRYLLIQLLDKPVMTCSHSASPAAAGFCPYTESSRLVVADLRTGQLRDLPSPRDLPASNLGGAVAW